MHRRWALIGLLSATPAVGCGSVSGTLAGTGGTGGTAGSGGMTGTGGATGSGGATGTGGAAPCAFASTYTIRDGGGLVAMQDTATLSPPNSFHYERMFVRTLDGGLLTCDPPMPACGDPARVDVSDVEAAMADPDVQTTLVLTTRKFFGDRAVADGPDFNFNNVYGQGFDVGLPCDTPSATCTPIPPGISALVTLLRDLIRQQRMDPACAAIVN